ITSAIAGIHRSSLNARDLAALDPGRREAGAAWNFALTLDASDLGPGGEPLESAPGPRLADAGPRPVAPSPHPPPPSALDAYTHVPYGADYYDTSEFMAGRVAVGVWLLDDSTPGFNWTSSEISQTLGGVQAGLDNWVRKGGAPTFLTFFIESHTNVPV